MKDSWIKMLEAINITKPVVVNQQNEYKGRFSSAIINNLSDLALNGKNGDSDFNVTVESISFSADGEYIGYEMGEKI